MKEQVNESKNIHQHVQKMFNDGALTLDDNGTYRAVTDPEEIEHCKS